VPDVDATADLLTSRPAATALLADFDGSLARIVNDPSAAVALPEALAVLAELVPRMGRVAIVSGRPVEFLRRRVPIPGIALAGLYGLERAFDGERVVDERVIPYLAGVAAAADEADARLPGILVERKADIAVTLHWRQAADRADEVCAVAEDLAARYGLDAPQRGRKAVELRPPVPTDKGTIVERLVDGYAVAAFAGDDAGDLPAFAALTRLTEVGRLDAAVNVGVASPEAPPALFDAVDVVVDGPDGLVVLLDAVAARLR
jgi:trehalose 6-phosphate phosphatase